MRAQHDTIQIERVALQLFGMLAPQTHLHAAMRSLGLSLAEAAPSFFDRVMSRVSELEEGKFTALIVEALGAQLDDETLADIALAEPQREWTEARALAHRANEENAA